MITKSGFIHGLGTAIANLHIGNFLPLELIGFEEEVLGRSRLN